MRIIKALTLVLSTLLLLGVMAHRAYAHFPASDGQINAILHVEPDDYPAARTNQTLYLILSDSSNRFKLSNCICHLSISQGGKLLDYSPFTSPPAGQPTIYSTNGLPFSFPAQGIYQISAIGQPITAQAFQTFNLSWNLQVGPPLKPASTFSLGTFLVYFVIITAVLGLAGVAVFLYT